MGKDVSLPGFMRSSRLRPRGLIFEFWVVPSRARLNPGMRPGEAEWAAPLGRVRRTAKRVRGMWCGVLVGVGGIAAPCLAGAGYHGPPMAGLTPSMLVAMIVIKVHARK
ncbi:MAG: hypothetical protein ACLQBA_05440 [Candidatus Binataceae bacterium]